MIVQFGLSGLTPEWQSAVVCLGTFDGVHLGHQAVISTAVRIAHERELPCCLLTFDRHPAATLRPEAKPPSLMGLEEKLALFDGLEVSGTVILPFDRQLSQMPATDFLEQVLQGTLKASAVVIGRDFCFGHNREGNAIWLGQRIETKIVPALQLEGRRVSSSLIRETVAQGDMETAGQMLGRPYAISGLVVQGQKLGRTIGYPTINLARPDDQAIPPNGIYAGEAETPFGRFGAAVSIGVRPTVGGSSRTVEAYLLDYPGQSLYGRHCSLALKKRLRDELKFEDLESLSEQIGRDVSAVRSLGVFKQ